MEFFKFNCGNGSTHCHLGTQESIACPCLLPEFSHLRDGEKFEFPLPEEFGEEEIKIIRRRIEDRLRKGNAGDILRIANLLGVKTE